MRPLATLKGALLGAALLAAGPSLAQTTTATLVGVITGNQTLDANQVYLIDGEVYVDNGATLTIPAGTILKGKQNPTSGAGASVLVVQRGGRLIANGTATAPIIFTAERDDVRNAFDLNETNRSLWGGVIVLGKATNNRGVRTIEGLPPTARTSYGCGDAGFACDDNDTSGSLRYISIRHAGFTLDANAEINGLTLGAVGRGTVLDYIEVFANSDDSFEFFGGTVDAKHLVGVFSGDDDLDWDTGYTGRIQFFFSIKDDAGDVGRCIEGDGSASPYTVAGQSSVTVSNMTCIGPGTGATSLGSENGGPSLLLRENTSAYIYNSVFVAIPSSEGGLEIENRADPATSSRAKFDAGTLDVRNNLFFDYSAGNTAAAIVNGTDTALEAAFAARNTIADPGLVSISRSANLQLDPRPMPSGAAATGANFTYAPLQNAGFETVTYRGAFEPGVPVWAAGWTALSQTQFFSGLATAANAGPLAEAGFSLGVQPNPASAGRALLTVELPEATAARLSVFDVLGREVAVVADQTLAAGTQTFALGRDLPAGVYIARLQTAEGATAVQFTVVR